MSLRILNIVGCRPNFIKIAPLLAEMKQYPEICPILVHTGQHYDAAMSDVFFQELDIPKPDFSLEVGSASYARQTAQIMERLEELLLDLSPDLVLVVGDVNSTIAATLTAVTMGYPVAHVEAGLRSFDREMPEEINRVLTDAASDFLFTTEESATANLLREGKAPDQIHFVGNVMIDSLVNNSEKISRSTALERFELSRKNYALVTLHRASNVDDPKSLLEIAGALRDLQQHIQLVFPVHPRTAARLEQFRGWEDLLSMPNLLVIEPLGYIDFMKLMKESLFVLTDSGGVQEETTALGVPCLTLRASTERPVTLTEGTNQLVGTAPEAIVAKGLEIINGQICCGKKPEKWDGLASKRIVSVIIDKTDEIKRLYRTVRERKLCTNTHSPASLHRV